MTQQTHGYVTGKKKVNHCSVYARQVSDFHYKVCSTLLISWKKKMHWHNIHMFVAGI
jgi:hypothetical protein